VVGQEYIQICDKGMTQRALWFTRDDDGVISKDDGIPLQFEASYTADRRAEAEKEFTALDRETQADEHQWMLNTVNHLPDCKAFAQALECSSFFNRVSHNQEESPQ